MKKLIVYKSKTGFALKYAEWLGTDLNIEVVSIKETKKIKFEEYDQVIFATSIFGNMLHGLNKMTKKNIKELVVLAVGYTPMSEEYENTLKDANKFNGKLFYVRGGINLEKLNFLSRAIIKKVTKETSSVDCSDENNLAKIKDYIKE